MPSAAASSAPATISAGARSPPSASTATRTKALRRGRAERLDLAALVRAAGRADGVRPLRLVTVRALLQARRCELEVRPALVAARFRGFALRGCHAAEEDSYGCASPGARSRAVTRAKRPGAYGSERSISVVRRVRVRTRAWFPPASTATSKSRPASAATGARRAEDSRGG